MSDTCAHVLIGSPRQQQTNMSTAMASDAVTGCPEDTGTRLDDGAGSPVKQKVEDRLTALSEQMSLCQTVLTDLRDLSEVLMRKSLQDVSLPPQK